MAAPCDQDTITVPVSRRLKNRITYVASRENCTEEEVVQFALDRWDDMESGDGLRQAAFHEAGHAVVACGVGLASRLICVHAEKMGDGKTRYQPHGTDMYGFDRSDPVHRRHAIKMITQAIAGQFAEEDECGTKTGVDDDLDAVGIILDRIAHDPADRDAISKGAYANARKLATHYKPAIDAVASQLRDVQCLTGKEVRDLIRTAMKPSPYR